MPVRRHSHRRNDRRIGGFTGRQSAPKFLPCRSPVFRLKHTVGAGAEIKIPRAVGREGRNSGAADTRGVNLRNFFPRSDSRTCEPVQVQCGRRAGVVRKRKHTLHLIRPHVPGTAVSPADNFSNSGQPSGRYKIDTALIHACRPDPLTHGVASHRRNHRGDRHPYGNSQPRSAAVGGSVDGTEPAEEDMTRGVDRDETASPLPGINGVPTYAVIGGSEEGERLSSRKEKRTGGSDCDLNEVRAPGIDARPVESVIRRLERPFSGGRIDSAVSPRCKRVDPPSHTVRFLPEVRLSGGAMITVYCE